MTRNEPDSNKQTPEGGAPIAGADPVYLRDPVLDATVRMVVELAAQVWVDRERLLAMEVLLAERGVVTPEALATFKPDAATGARFKAERTRFIENLLTFIKAIFLFQ